MAQEEAVGPATETRFPPLVVPAGFEATLFACDPLVEYPSVIALGPRPGSLFVAHDYMTGLGVEITRRDEIRLLIDSDGDGYADRSSLFAEGFNSIQGLAFDGEAVYVMHAPYLTRVRDVDGNDVAEERSDLLGGLGLPPEENSNRLHCANGVVVGHDGWLYLALGDQGCDTARPEGDRLLFRQGGILRCRTDGTDLHVFSSGLRNIYDVALDDELNVFVRDNENDGGDYMIRVCHCFHGSDHGYPYHYYERPEEHLAPLADLGRGSSAGGVTYLESAFPDEYQHSLYFCEWGRAVVRYPLTACGSSFAGVQEFDFAAGAANDPYGFKPTDLVVDYDGSLLISDWGDGQRPKRGRGRIYRIAAADAANVAAAPADGLEQLSRHELIAELNAPGYLHRVAAQRAILHGGRESIDALRAAWRKGVLNGQGELHAVWILALSGEPSSIHELLTVAESHGDPRVMVQAVRAIADLSDPILLSGRLGAGPGDLQVGRRLVKLAALQADPRLDREVVIALGRLRYADTSQQLREIMVPGEADAALSHAVVRSLRRSGNWPAVLQCLDAPAEANADENRLRSWALLALAEQGDAVIVDGLIERLSAEHSSQRRMEYADLLSRVARLAGPWTYWGFRPGQRPANTQNWDRTERIETALGGELLYRDHDVRAFTLRRLLREELPLPLEALSRWLQEESDAEHVGVILNALTTLPNAETFPLFEQCVLNRAHSTNNRLRAVGLLCAGLAPDDESRLLRVAADVEDGPVLAALLAEAAIRTNLDADAMLLRKLDSQVAIVRAAALRAMTARRAVAVREHVAVLLKDADADVAREAVAACSAFGLREHCDRILELVGRDEPELQRECLLALSQLDDPRALSHAVAGLENAVTRLASLEYLAHFGGPAEGEAVEHTATLNLDAEIQIAAVRAITSWLERASPEECGELRQAVARIQGRSGALTVWLVAGPQSNAAVESALGAFLRSPLDPEADVLSAASPRIAEGAAMQIGLEPAQGAENSAWLAAADVYLEEAGDVELLASSGGTLAIWVNGALVLERDVVAEFRPNSDKAATRLNAGLNRIVVRINQVDAASAFHVGFRRRSSKAEHESIMQYVLATRGDSLRGRELFANQEKSWCAKCHRLGAEGPRIGPDLTGIGRRFSRVNIVESILDPGRTIAPSYGTVAVLLQDGRIVTGTRVARDESTMTIGDNQGQLHPVPLDEIDVVSEHEVSTMPLGLEQRLNRQELLDLIEFLSQQVK